MGVVLMEEKATKTLSDDCDSSLTTYVLLRIHIKTTF